MSNQRAIKKAMMKVNGTKTKKTEIFPSNGKKPIVRETSTIGKMKITTEQE